MARRFKASEGTDGAEAMEAGPEVAGTPRKRKPKTTIRQTYDLPFDLDFRLTGVAKFVGMRKSAFVLKLLDQGCRGYKIDKALGSAWAETQGQDVSGG
jgi:hypothetical protein